MDYKTINEWCAHNRLTDLDGHPITDYRQAVLRSYGNWLEPLVDGISCETHDAIGALVAECIEPHRDSRLTDVQRHAALGIIIADAVRAYYAHWLEPENASEDWLC